MEVANETVMQEEEEEQLSAEADVEEDNNCNSAAPPAKRAKVEPSNQIVAKKEAATGTAGSKGKGTHVIDLISSDEEAEAGDPHPKPKDGDSLPPADPVVDVTLVQD